MFISYKFSEENQEAYKELCQKFLHNKGLFQCQHQDWVKRIGTEENASQSEKVEETPRKKEDEKNLSHTPKKRKIERRISLSSVASDASETVKSGTLDFKALQKNLVAYIHNSSKFSFSTLQSVPPETVCENAHAPSEEVLVQICKKCEKLDDNVIKAVCTLLVLPKIYHLPSKLSASSCSALSDFVQWHPSPVIVQALIPLLQYCPKMQEQHRDALVQLLQDCTPNPNLITQMLNAMCARKDVSEIDIQVFHLLCEKSDHQSEATHAAVLTYLSKASEGHKRSIKLGHCLLFVVKKMGSSIHDQDALQHIITNHNSSLKKAIEVQLKKIAKNKR